MRHTRKCTCPQCGDITKVMVIHPGFSRLITREEAEATFKLSQDPAFVEKEVQRSFVEFEKRKAEVPEKSDPATIKVNRLAALAKAREARKAKVTAKQEVQEGKREIVE